MMEKNKLKYYITADHTGFEKGMRAATNTAKTAAKAITVGFAATTAAVTASSVAILTAATASAQQAKEIENLSRLAKLSTQDFRAYSFAFEQVGVSQEKFADITKDLQDKLGDFIATGGGEFKDFFENVAPKVGLTAKELAKLSGPDALVAVKRAMDAANVSAEQQVFYLESLANDAALLTPLLKDGGKALEEQAKKAKDLGIALSTIDNDNLVDLARSTQDVTRIFGAMVDKVSAELAPAIIDVVDEFTEWWKVNNKIVTQDIAGFIKGVGTALSNALENARKWNDVWSNFYKKRQLQELTADLKKAKDALFFAKNGISGFGDGINVTVEGATARVNSLQRAIENLRTGKNPFEELAGAVDVYGDSLDKGGAATDRLVIKATKLKKVFGDVFKETEKTSKSAIIHIKKASNEVLDYQKEVLASQREMVDGIDSNLEDFFDDVEVRSERATSEMSEGWNNFADDAEYAFRVTLGESLRGEFDSLGDAFESFVDSMVSAFIGGIAKMVAEWASSSIASLFTGSATGASGFSLFGGSGGSGGGGLIGSIGTSIAGSAAWKAVAGSSLGQSVSGGIGSLASALGFGASGAASGAGVGVMSAVPAYQMGAAVPYWASGGLTGGATAGTSVPVTIEGFSIGASSAAETSGAAISGGALAVGGIASVIALVRAAGDMDWEDVMKGTNPSELASTGYLSTTNYDESQLERFGTSINSIAKSSYDAADGIAVFVQEQESHDGVIEQMTYNLKGFNEATGEWTDKSDTWDTMIRQMTDIAPATDDAVVSTAAYVAEMQGMPSVADELTAAYNQLTGTTAIATGSVEASVQSYIKSMYGVTLSNKDAISVLHILDNTINSDVENIGGLTSSLQRMGLTSQQASSAAVLFANNSNDLVSALSAASGASSSFASSAYSMSKTLRSAYGAMRSTSGVPGFASGGLHEGGVRVVGENGPEIELTGPSRILSNSDSKGLFGGPQEIKIYVQQIIDSKVIKEIVDKHIVNRTERGTIGRAVYAAG